jgi:hypothetical protein
MRIKPSFVSFGILLLIFIALFTQSAIALTNEEETLKSKLDNAVNDTMSKMQENLEANKKCFRCHGAEGLKTESNGKKISLHVNESTFNASIHGTNRCTTCHKGLTDYPHKDVIYGKEFAKRVTDNCLKCHENITKKYRDSAHGEAMIKDNKPVYCFDCHGFHDIFKKEDSRSKVHSTNQFKTCSRCHKEEQAESFSEGFHTKAAILGSKKAANCADCHTSHSIWGPKNIKSTISKANTPKTCAKCHVYSRDNYAKGPEHWVASNHEGENAPMYYTYKFFTWLTVMTVTVLILHILLELYRKLRNINSKSGGGSNNEQE